MINSIKGNRQKLPKKMSSSLHKRNVKVSKEDVDDILSSTTSVANGVSSDVDNTDTDTIEEPKLKKNSALVNNLLKIESIVTPILITLISFYLRFYKVGKADKIIWDEAHFAKFGSYYVNHSYYFDVHPPIGKMLIGLTEYLSGLNNTDFEYKSGTTYPKNIPYETIRMFQVVVSSLIPTVGYFTTKALNFSLLTTYLITIMVTFENTFIVLGKFILLDSFLILFMTLTFLGYAMLFRYRNQEFSKNWKIWLNITGISIGLACGVKLVGLFITSVIGLYTIMELWLKFWYPNQFNNPSNKSDSKSNKLSLPLYARQWIIRVISLILIPAAIFVFGYKIHFGLLTTANDASNSMSTLFQAHLNESPVAITVPRDVAYGSIISLKSQGPSPQFLHSHNSIYPDGSKQYQVTTYGFRDHNNNYIVNFNRGNTTQLDQSADMKPTEIMYLQDGDVIRLVHTGTKANLHSHEVKGHVTKNQWEVSGYGDYNIGDEKDNWVVEIVGQLHSPNSTYSKLYENELSGFYERVHPLSTSFRLRHSTLGCYLATTGENYPTWAFKQGEVVCAKSKLGKSSVWNVEYHENSQLPYAEDYECPESSFLEDFLVLNKAQMRSNNGLVPDPAKKDDIASFWWEWPILLEGLRMSSWSDRSIKYLMMGNPIIFALTTPGIFAFIGYFVYLALLWNRQALVLSESDAWYLVSCGIFPFLGYFMNYLPYIIMSRVTYFHHYMPSLYFAIFVFGFITEVFTKRLNKYVRFAIYLTLISLVIASFVHFSPFCLGMEDKITDYKNLDWGYKWRVVHND